MSILREAVGTVSIEALSVLALGAADRLTVPEFCTRFALAPTLLADPDARVPVALMVRVWDELPAMVDDENAFGLHLAERAVAAPLGLAGHLVTSAASLEHGLRRVLAFQRVFHDGALSRLALDGQRAVIRLDPLGMRMPRHATEFEWAWLVLISRRMTGANITPLSVVFTHPSPPSRSEHVRVFGVSPKFDGELPELVLRRTDLDRSSRGADPALGAILESHARLLQARLPATQELIDRARAAVHAAILMGKPTVAAVASQLDIAPRTLQRRLREYDTSLVQLIDEVRVEAARRWLADPTVSVAEIAFGLGFAEVSAFHRAFVRWTGATPGQFRRGEQVARKSKRVARPAKARADRPGHILSMNGR
jgi:AraC-like DNA-binding protein